MKYLYHFTTEEAYKVIKECGYIKPLSISPLSLEPLIWLSITEDQDKMPLRNSLEKFIRFKIEAESFECFTLYDLIRGNEKPSGLTMWHDYCVVIKSNIYFDKIVEVSNINTGKLYYSKYNKENIRIDV